MREFVNCMSYALDVEGRNLGPFKLDLYYSHGLPENEIRYAAEKLGRKIRKLENKDDPLNEGEWLIAFFGFIPIRYDAFLESYLYDYHFIKFDGQWMHRRYINSKITPVREELFLEFESQGFEPMYFAVKRMEN